MAPIQNRLILNGLGKSRSFATLVSLLALAVYIFVASGEISAQGSEEIPFYKHTIDLEQSEAAAVADINQDGKLDIISGENWYEQTTPGNDGPRWIKHRFRELGYYRFDGKFTGGYLKDLGDLAIDVNGDGYPDIVTSSWWDPSLTWGRTLASQTSLGSNTLSIRAHL